MVLVVALVPRDVVFEDVVFVVPPEVLLPDGAVELVVAAPAPFDEPGALTGWDEVLLGFVPFPDVAAGATTFAPEVVVG